MPRRRRICLRAGIIFGLALWSALQIASAAESKRVLLLYYSFGGNQVNATHFRSALEQQSQELLEIYDAPLGTARPANEDVVARYADYLHALLPDQRLDLVVAVGASAVSLSQRYRRQNFPFTPMLAIAEERRIPLADLRENDVVAPTKIDLAGVIENILRVLPRTTNVAVVIGNSPSERFWLEQLHIAFEPFAGRVSFIYFNELSFSEILTRVAALPPRSAIFHLMLLTDAAGTTHDDTQVLRRLHAVANAPIFSYYDNNFGDGIIGGPLISVQARSQVAAEVALRMLRGEKSRDLKVQPVGFAAPKFDWREMRRWGVSANSLPLGSEIYFRSPSAWEQYRGQILAIVAALLAQAALVVWLVYEIGRRHRAEIQSRRSMAELTYMNRKASAEQRSATLAHEIRQPLAGIATRASAALRWLRMEKPDLEKAQTALEAVVAASHRAGDIIGNVSAMFKKEPSERVPTDINQIILTVLSTVRVELQQHSVDLQTHLNEHIPTVLGDKVQLQQVVLNLVMNAVEGMQSVQTRVLKVQTHQTNRGMVRVSIEDTGTGIDPSNIDRVFKPFFTTKANGMGMGLAICRSIIENHDGRIWVSARTNGGSIFQLELPTSVTQH
jgi:signal transduction histidine kinase